MNYKFCKKRRLFLAQTSMNLGLFTAANLFSLNSFAQTSTPKKNVIFIFFNHSANIPFGDNDRNFHKGGWTFGNGSNINGMNSIAGDSLFIRGVRSTGNGHPQNAYSAFMGAAENQGDSGIDVVMGDKLKDKYKTNIGHWSLGFNMHQGDKIPRNPNTNPLWRTTTFRSRKLITPEISVDSAFKKMQSNLNCSNIPTDNTSNEQRKAQLNNEIKKLEIIQSNYNDFKDTRQVPKQEIEKLESQLSKKIASHKKLIADINNGNGDDLGDLCKDLKNPKDSYNFNDGIKPNLNKHVGRESYNNFHNKSLAFFDLMVSALKLNYTRSITYHTNIWNGGYHGHGGHAKINNSTVKRYLDELSKTLNHLYAKLKKAGIYDETMIILAGEFPHQNRGNDNDATHRGDNMPWLIVNSGKNGDTDLKRKIHPGDIHCNISNRMGFAINTFGGNHRYINNRKGNFDTKLFA